MAKTVSFSEFFELFHNQVSKRITKPDDLKIFGEDSIRYDFCYTAQKYFGLSPEDIVLEQEIPKSLYKPKPSKKGKGQGRYAYKPEYDLRIDKKEKLPAGIIAEFSFFRRIDGPQQETANHGKLLRDMFRLAYLKSFTNEDGEMKYMDFRNYKSLLICVTDNDMIQYNKNKEGKVYSKSIAIQDKYELNNKLLDDLPKTALERIETKFLNLEQSKKIIPTADKIFDSRNDIKDHNENWTIWIWEVNFKKP